MCESVLVYLEIIILLSKVYVCIYACLQYVCLHVYVSICM